MNEQDATAPAGTVPTPTWVFIGNTNRPNGGLFQRFAGLTIPIIDGSFDGATPTQTAGAAAGDITTYDISGQYDFFSDYPTYPLNLLADLNAVVGILAVHANYGDIGILGAPGYLANGGHLDMSQAVLQDRYSDTTYYLIPARRLPLLAPLQLIGVPDPVLAVLDAPLRVLVEAGYDRTTSPGVPTAAQWAPHGDPSQLVENFLTAIPTGVDDGLQEVGLGRPFRTTPAGLTSRPTIRNRPKSTTPLRRKHRSRRNRQRSPRRTGTHARTSGLPMRRGGRAPTDLRRRRLAASLSAGRHDAKGLRPNAVPRTGSVRAI